MEFVTGLVISYLQLGKLLLDLVVVNLQSTVLNGEFLGLNLEFAELFLKFIDLFVLLLAVLVEAYHDAFVVVQF